MLTYDPSPVIGGAPKSKLPIVVDLDGTLVLSDTLHETAAMALFRNPVGFGRSLLSLTKGRHALKAALASEVNVVDEVFPLREDLVKWLREKAQEGHKLHLCSAADQTIVDKIAQRVGIFASATGSANVNLKGKAKAAYLQKQFPSGFIYAGDHDVDIPVWEVSDGIVLAGTSQDVSQRAKMLGKPILQEFHNTPLKVREFMRAIRVHHWTKNILLFVPIILAHEWTNPSLIAQTILAFFCLLAVTSATYLLNDIADLNADRHHWSKRSRALASGRLAISSGFFIAGSLLLGGFFVALILSLEFATALLAYLLITGSYSLGLKRVPLLDTLIIGILFTTRLIMGITLLENQRPEWLLTFAVFFFFSLATAKRHTEIVRAASSGADSLTSRGYQLEDAALTLALGVGAAIASLVVFMIFVLQELTPGFAYTRPELLSGISIIMSIWLGRIWLLSHRGQMNDDPVSFAIRDRVSIGLGIVVALLFLVAL
ncbi:UbiA family prenyltransferase [Rhizobium sp. B230/85]|uniref:UbiA family prenyltransferase n=1 Tax=unclassified Rhizobium TaxID=2613769 RepID=UPI001ADA00BA|nr:MULTISPECIES: UbiA family prenyltransferase [unclassified Rhizobium]MBO9136811.1 UbiA family prenyltransferase [Rhizobium sp. B209b/85]QXZ99014.1 UbiA family prenyltransferase [Rhizobium sp. B230/85]